ncbi:MAG TPA: hypothetical protein VF487_02910 [Chitinophagaceae bacterium]
MSSGLQHKMYNYEVAPPAGAWEKITASLDESHLTDKFPSVLYNSMATPAAAIWETITANLDELSLSTQYPSALYNMQAPPPATAWEKIKATLEQGDEKVIAPRRRITPFLRYAAAAVLIGAVAFGTIQILNTNKKTGEAVALKPSSENGMNNTPAVKPETGSLSPVAPNEEAVQSQEARNDAALQESKHTFASLDRNDQIRMKKVSNEFFQTAANPINIADALNPASTYQDLECAEVNAPVFAGGNSSINMASRYVMLMTPDGRIMRISKKLGDLVCCVSGEEIDEDCKDQLKKWRQKMADAPVSPAPGNFMGILDVLNTLKDSRL